MRIFLLSLLPLALGCKPPSPASGPEASAPPAAAGPPEGSPAPAEVLAQIGPIVLSRQEFERRLTYLPEEMRPYLATPAGLREVLEVIIREKIVLSEAARLELDQKPEVRRKLEEAREALQQEMEQRLADLRDELLLQAALDGHVKVSPEEVAAFYEQHRTWFEKPEEIRVSHILLASEEEAKEIRKMALAPGASFADLARKYSVDRRTAEKGGDIGYFGRLVFDPAFEEAAFALKKRGEISPPVKTPLGWHVLKLTGRREAPGGPQTLEQARPSLEAALRKRKQNEWLAGLRENYKVMVDERMLADVWKGLHPK